MLNTSTGVWTGIAYGNTPKYISGIKNKTFISEKDRRVLSGLAEEVFLLSERPQEKIKRKYWYRLNSLECERPLIYCDPENGWNEIITGDHLECSGDLARRWEWVLRREVFTSEELNDDNQ